MGKLHKIRKAIEANPEAFIGIWGDAYGVRFYDFDLRGIVQDGKARPEVNNSHRPYVRKVLRELGYPVR